MRSLRDGTAALTWQKCRVEKGEGKKAKGTNAEGAEIALSRPQKADWDFGRSPCPAIGSPPLEHAKHDCSQKGEGYQGGKHIEPGP
jgi:hypothetical protein